MSLSARKILRPLEQRQLVRQELPEEDAVAPEELADAVLDQLRVVDRIPVDPFRIDGIPVARERAAGRPAVVSRPGGPAPLRFQSERGQSPSRSPGGGSRRRRW